MIYLSKGGAGADSDHTWIRPCWMIWNNQFAVEIEKLQALGAGLGDTRKNK